MSEHEFSSLLARMEPIINSIAWQASIPGMDAEDIAQEFRIRLWEKADMFVNGKSKPETYANTVFKNMLRNMYRDQSRPWRHTLSLDHSLDDDSDCEDGFTTFLKEEDLTKCFDSEVLASLVAFEEREITIELTISRV